jgi:glycosyltransferase involved in cell wall biosynthesis
VRFCTSFSTSELPHARVLAEALRRHHPDATLHALVLGRTHAVGLPFDVVTIADLDLGDDAAEILRTYLREDLALLLRPALLAHVRALGGPGDVCFLSVDHDVLAPVEADADAAGGVGIVWRLDGELPDDTFAPGAGDLAAQGLCSPDFLVLGHGGRSDDFLDWYRNRLRALRPRLTRSETPPARAAAPRRARARRSRAPPVLGLRPIVDPGYEVSAWNLQERPLARVDGRVLAGGSPLRTLHFEGFDPRKPYWLAEHADRVRVVDDPVLGELCDDYAQRLLRHGMLRSDRRRDVGHRLPNGLVFDARLLELYEEALNSGAELPDIFTASGCEEFMAWMLGPAPAGAASAINRYLYRVYLDRHDLPQAYPDLDGADGDGYAAWTWVFGRREMSIPDEFLPPRPDSIVEAEVTALPAPGVNVAGFFRGTLGLGEAARLYVKALEAANVPVTTTTVEVDRPVEDAHRRLGKDYGNLDFASLEAAEECAFNLICVNADELPRFIGDAGADFFAGRRSIGVWAWETDVIPDRWDEAYAYLDEIWVYSRYVAENLGRASPIPVVCVPPPVVAPDSGGASSGIELPAGFRFMFMFDLFSTQSRKNPAGVIEAFSNAFAPGEGPQLLIKTIHAEARPREYDELRHAAAGRPDVHIVDRALSSAAKNALMAECDCYVSLHRSEGYGLPLAECMALGKPVIGTAYSGNLDFMSPANSYLVDHSMTVVGDDVEIYPPEGRWAEPDLDHAAALMRQVYEDPGAARARGARARADIAATLSPESVGRIAADRLRRLMALGAAVR